jgi:hypothetical protein
MNVEIGTEAEQFPEKEYINGIFFTVQAAFVLSIKKGLVYCMETLLDCRVHKK